MDKPAEMSPNFKLERPDVVWLTPLFHPPLVFISFINAAVEITKP